MFAEDITGWLAAALLLFGGSGASLLALGALIPAWRGNRPLTLALIAPAILAVGLTICRLAAAYFLSDKHDHQQIMENFVKPWLFMALVPSLTSLVALGVVIYRKRILSIEELGAAKPQLSNLTQSLCPD